MSISQNINQSQIQKLAMTQQMQQSIKVLKSTTEELCSFLKQKELENPFIEIGHHPLSNSSNIDLNELVSNFNQFSPSLDDYLIEQVHLTMRNTPIRTMVIYLIENLDENGYLSINIEDLYQEQKFDKNLVLDALTLLQQLDPPGIGARNLQECLILQTEYDSNAPKLALPILKNDFQKFTAKDWKFLAQKYDVSITEIQKILNYVRTLSPAPGASYQNTETEYIYPDLIVQIIDDRPIVKSTKYSFPEINFKNQYFESLTSITDKEVQNFLQEKQKEFKALKDEVNQRAITILKVGQAIVDHQTDFFIKSDHPLKPLLLRDIAHQLQLHESTISRAVNGKYLKTDFGIFELKTFFSTAAKYAKDKEISSHNVRQMIQELIENEDKKHPLSDQKIVTILQRKNIEISRRTVAKYRSQLNIASSSKRKIL